MRLRSATHVSAVQSTFSSGHDSSSFGPIGHISEVSAGRLKGFIGYANGENSSSRITPIETDEHVRFIGDVVKEGISRIDGAEHLTRLSIRTIVSNSMLEQLGLEVNRSGAQIEASMPVSDSHQIVYIGYNSTQRSLNQSQAASNNEAIQGAIASYGPDTDYLRRLAREINTNASSYSMEIFNPASRSLPLADMANVAALLSTFGYDSAGSRALVSNPYNTIGIVYDESGVSRRAVGISVVERREIGLSSGASIYIAEVTDGTVAQDSNGRSLYSALLSRVFADIAENSREVSLIYAETNVGKEPLLKTAVIQGRQFNGILPNHALIRNRTTGELEMKSLAVTSLTRDQLTDFLTRLKMETAAQQAIRS